jgi:hypothetical protein
MRRVLAATSACAVLVTMAAVSVLTSGCGNSSPTSNTIVPTPTPVPTRSVVTVSVSPNPIIATASGDPNYPWDITYNVTITETAGLACNINRVITNYRDKTTGVEFQGSTYNPADFNGGTGSNFIAGSGSKSFSLSARYRGGFGGKQVTLTLTAEVIDANQNIVTGATSVEVLTNHVGGRL